MKIGWLCFLRQAGELQSVTQQGSDMAISSHLYNIPQHPLCAIFVLAEDGGRDTE